MTNHTKNLPKIQTPREQFALVVSRILLVVCFVEACCWLGAALSNPSIMWSDLAPALIGTLLLLFLHMPFLIILMIALIYSLIKNVSIGDQTVGNDRMFALFMGACFAIVVTPILVIIALTVKNYWPMFFAFGVFFASLLTSNIVYEKRLETDQTSLYQKASVKKTGSES